jgi:septal ring factor EnvC (AmiA/AmiB activator)
VSARKVLVTMAILGGIALAAVWGLTNRATADRWRTRSQDVGRDLAIANEALATANRQVDQLSADLNDIRPRVVATEAELRSAREDLEAARAQLAVLAASKAELGDRNKELLALLADGERASEGLQVCVRELAAGAAGSGPSQGVIDRCNEALVLVGGFDAAVRQLGPVAEP